MLKPQFNTGRNNEDLTPSRRDNDDEETLKTCLRSRTTKDVNITMRYNILWTSNLERFFFFFFFLAVLVCLNSGLHACQAGALSLEPHLQPFLFWFF
jgi:hypothetical protein